MLNKALEVLVQRLAMRASLTLDDRDAILALPATTRVCNPSAYLVRQGEPRRSTFDLIQSGFAIRHKVTNSGARQIVAVLVPGDLIDLQHIFLDVSDHNVQALTEMHITRIDFSAFRDLALERPTISEALWTEVLVEASIYREWVTNVGRRSARARIAHLLCEFCVRMRALGETADRFELPLTQEQLADAVGLTNVHVSRVLKDLRADGIIQRDKRFISYNDWTTLAEVADFNPLYLHLNGDSPSS